MGLGVPQAGQPASSLCCSPPQVALCGCCPAGEENGTGLLLSPERAASEAAASRESTLRRTTHLPPRVCPSDFLDRSFQPACPWLAGLPPLLARSGTGPCGFSPSQARRLFKLRALGTRWGQGPAGVGRGRVWGRGESPWPKERVPPVCGEVGFVGSQGGSRRWPPAAPCWCACVCAESLREKWRPWGAPSLRVLLREEQIVFPLCAADTLQMAVPVVSAPGVSASFLSSSGAAPSALYPSQPHRPFRLQA